MGTNEQKYVEKVLKNYTPKEASKLDELRTLDKKATQPATVFAAIFGAIGSLVLGFGMCVAMEVIMPGLMWVGILVGFVGILMVSVNYCLYKKILKKGRAKYADQITTLSNELLNK